MIPHLCRNLQLHSFSKIHTPRVLSPSQLSLLAYRRQLTERRRQIIEEVKQYQQKLQDDFLKRNQEEVAEKYRKHQEDIRARVAIQAETLTNKLKIWKQQDAIYQQKMANHLELEQIRKANRDRIRRILQFEANNHWINPSNMEKRLAQNVIFPPYLASSEYYYKLHAEALAYDNLDFDALDKISSAEESVKEKNKYLMPLYSQLKRLIAHYKNTPITTNRLTEHTEQLKTRLNCLLELLTVWYQYTKILGMSSSQVLQLKQEKKDESQIKEAQISILNQRAKLANKAFVGAVEEDTEEKEITLSQYLQSVRESTIVSPEETNEFSQLNSLLNAAMAEQGEAIKFDQDQEMLGGIGSTVTTNKGSLADPSTTSNSNFGIVGDALLNPGSVNTAGKQSLTGLGRSFDETQINHSETSSTVQILKDMMGQADPELVRLLDRIGGTKVFYAELLKKVFDSVK